jgi:NADH-quinone oxidoreductase subunit F
MVQALADRDRIFTNLYGYQSPDIDAAMVRGDWDGTRDLLRRDPDAIIAEIGTSGLRGRGGGGFPTGRKWALMPSAQGDPRPRFLVVNADESEPGTCTNREILRHEPHKVVESALLAGRAIRARAAYVYVRGEYVREAQALERAIGEAYARGYLGKNVCGSGIDFDMFVHRGAGAYICGEETAMLESLEGRKGQPRLRPPYPAVSGLYGCPTTVNNLETIATVSTILRRGAGWFAGLGAPTSAGPKLFCFSGHVARPCVVEEVMGLPFRAMIEQHCGGIAGGWDNLQAVMPGGASMPMLPARLIADAAMDFDSLKALGSGLGSAAVIVMDRSADVVRAVARLSTFFAHESCGQCTPCREGTGWMARIMARMVSGEAELAEIDMLEGVTRQVEGHTICGLGEAASWPIQALIRHFRPELEARIARYREERLPKAA